MAKKPMFKELKKLLTLDLKPAHDVLSDGQRMEVDPFCNGYRAFLDAAKTERLAVKEITRQAKKAGFKVLSEKAAGNKFVITYRGKAAALVFLGKRPIAEGLNVVVSHLDSPRLDLKPTPLYESQGLAMLKTHYYGGIRKHQWVARPLAMYGIVVKADGKTVDIAIGDDAADPVFTVTDLLPHLSANAQNPKKIGEAIPGEKLNVVFGGRTLGKPADGKDRVKLHVLKLLHDKYGMIEEDFISAEIELVPAGFAREVGLDRALIGAYGQDDRVCAYTALRAIADLAKAPARTAVALFVDKEEIGSYGNTGATARFFLDLVGLLLERGGPTSELAVRRAVAASNILSADVNAALDPTWPEVHDKRNAAVAGKGICITKYTGSRGKGGASDAGAEFVGKIRSLLNAGGVPWQTGELGKIDEGGGGTVALYFAMHGAEVLDAGPALLSMHSPFELSHKDDVFSAFLTYKLFFEKA
jgi:aspartyl aminopeptidase